MEGTNAKISHAFKYLEIDSTLLAKIKSKAESAFFFFLLQVALDYK